ncbi:MAG: hypothetical protein AAGB29_10620 [Planctomycetota bacterium]
MTQIWLEQVLPFSKVGPEVRPSRPERVGYVVAMACWCLIVGGTILTAVNAFDGVAKFAGFFLAILVLLPFQLLLNWLLLKRLRYLRRSVSSVKSVDKESH